MLSGVNRIELFDPVDIPMGNCNGFVRVTKGYKSLQPAHFGFSILILEGWRTVPATPPGAR
jgi:hypothetical protein